jgi:hypothetical protein
MEACVTVVLLTVVSGFVSALAGAANPATARMPVSKNVAASFFILVLSINWLRNTLRAQVYGHTINSGRP